MTNKVQWSARFEGSRFYLRTPYEEVFVGELKDLVPARSRFWDGWHKEWQIAASYWSEVEDLLQGWWGDGSVLDTVPHRMAVSR